MPNTKDIGLDLAVVGTATLPNEENGILLCYF